MSPRASLLFTILLSAAPCLAQQVWIVDKLDRRGTDFTTVSGAYNAAAVGDILYLRDHGPGPHFYTMPALNKGITIISESSTRTVFGPQFGIVPISIPAGQRLELINVPTVGINCSNCQGELFFEDCSLGGTRGSTLTDCVSVEIVRCIWDTRNSPIQITRSKAVFIDSRAYSFPSPSGNVECINATDSELTLVNSVVEGANGMIGIQCQTAFAPSHAIIMNNSTVHVGRGSSVLPGLLGGGPTYCSYRQGCAGYWPFIGTGTVYLDPGATTQCTLSPIVRQGVVTTLRAGPAGAGQSLFLELRAEPGALVFALLDVPSPTATVLGPAALDPFQAEVVGTGIIPTAGTLQFTTTLEGVPPLGFEMVAQGVAFEPQGTATLTNPAPMVVQRPVRTAR